MKMERTQQESIRPASPPAAEMVEIRKKKDVSAIDAKLAALIAASMFFGVFTRIAFDTVSLDFFYLQIFSSFYIGYRCRAKTALIAGALIFFPNLILHIVGILVDAEANRMTHYMNFTGDLFSGRMSFFADQFYSRTLLFAYFYYTLFAFAVAVIKSMISKLMEDETFQSIKKLKYEKNLSFKYTVAILFLSVSLGYGPIAVNFTYALLPIFSLWIYRYGFEQAKYLFVSLMVVQIVTIRSDMVAVFNLIGYVNLTILALLLLIYSNLKIESSKIDNIGSFILTLMAICFFTGFSFRISYDFRLQTIALALPSLFFLGYKYHCRAGMLGGLILGLGMIIRFQASYMIIWGSSNIQFILAAPLIGYLGGTDFSKKNFLNNGMKILGIYYSILLLATVTNYGFSVERNLDDLVNMGASIILLLLLSIRAKQHTTLKWT